MSQDVTGVSLDTSLGYLLKEAASALRTAMEGVLRPMDMSITHYACLELLAQRPGLSNSELARGAFVSRQSMNVLLQALEREGLVSRATEASVGRILPTELTAHGRQQLEAASAAVKAVEDTMRSGLTDDEQKQLQDMLRTCVASLQHVEGAPVGTDRSGSEKRSVGPRHKVESTNRPTEMKDVP